MTNKDDIYRILECATRAPSTHNTQPWLFRVIDSTIEVFYDPSYKLEFADKEGRDLYISMGCMLENMRIASLELGFTPSFTFGPFGDETQVAQVVLEKSDTSKESDLYSTIATRVNARGNFDKETIPEDLMSEIKTLAGQDEGLVSFVTEQESIKSIAGATSKAIEEAYEQKNFRREMSQWMNSNLSNKKEGLPGYALKMPLLVSLVISPLIRYFNIGKFISKKSSQAVVSAPLVVVLANQEDQKSWIKTGMLGERIMLYLQSKGYQTSIYVGALEIGEHYKKVKNILNIKERPQFLFCVGHIKGPHRTTPRHPLKVKLVE